ncbi:MAG: hypothetical protein PHD95_04290 [Candidatus ainarchaeum sp.]|nr:hypothetical protein [Candidatus ainarchaeum sp.]
MQTTIQVEKTTVQALELMKQKMKTKSHNETILALIRKNEKIPDSLFGCRPDLKTFVREEDDREL